jgi:hypothetical protein
MIGLLGRVISPSQGRYLHRTQNKCRGNIHASRGKIFFEKKKHFWHYFIYFRHFSNFNCFKSRWVRSLPAPMPWQQTIPNIIFLNLTLFILVRHTTKLNYRIIVVNTAQCDSICIIFSDFTCFGQLTIFRRFDDKMFRNCYYIVRNIYLELYTSYLLLLGLETC